MRRPPHQKTSPRTLALPGFVVSGMSKMRGLMDSVVSFERVQMSPYWRSPLLLSQAGPIEAGRSNAGSAQCPRASSQVRDSEPAPPAALYLNAFKWPPPGSMLWLRMAAAQLTATWVSALPDGSRSALSLEHALRAPCLQRSPLPGCRGMERAFRGQRGERLVGSPALRLLQTTRTRATTTRQLLLASEPTLEQWNLNLPAARIGRVADVDCSVAVEEPSPTLWVLACSSSASQSVVATGRKQRSPISIRKAWLADLLRDAAACPAGATSLCITAGFDPPGCNIEAPLQFIFRRRACTVARPLGRTASAARDIARRRSADPSHRRPDDAGLSPLGRRLYRSSPERPLRAHCARSHGAATCECWRRKVTTATAPLASAPGLNRPQELRRPGAPLHHQTHPFERVQMSPRLRPIYPAGRTTAPAATTGHSVIGGTPMHRLK